MIIPIESFDKLTASIVFFLSGIWLYCAYTKSGRSNAIFGGLYVYFMIMSVYSLFAAAGMMLLMFDSEEISIPLYNAAYIVANLLFFLSCAQIIGFAIELYFERAELRINAKKYYQAIILICGLVIIIVSAFYQAKPSFDDELFLIRTNADSSVYRMTVALALLSMVPASLLIAARSFFEEGNARVYAMMGIGVGLMLVGLMPRDEVRSLAYPILADTAVMAGSIILFYGANSVSVSCKHQIDPIK